MDTMTDGRYRIIGFGGGIRGAKSWGSLGALLTLCKVYPGSRWAVIRQDLQRLRQTTIPSFQKLLTDHLRGFVVDDRVDGNFEAHCINGSQILFRGENIDTDPELLRFHGYEVNGFLNEEADELAERTLTKEIERAGTWIVPNGGAQPPAYILNTFNPTSRWPKKVFYVPWRDGTLKPPYAFIPTTAADNPFISDDQREAWKDLPANEYKRFVVGDWDSLTGAYYDQLSTKHLIERSELPTILPSYWRYYGSYDWGYRHWSVMCAWATDEDGTDYLLDSLWLRGLQDDELATEYKRDLPPQCLGQVYAGHDCWNKVVAHGASGENTFEIFARKGIYLLKADIDLVNGGRAVNRALKIGDGRPQTYIVRTPGNLRLFEQLGEIMPDKDDIRKPGKVDADADGKGGDDGADAFRYGVATRIMTPKSPEIASVPQDRSPGYDYDKGQPRKRPTADEEVARMFERANPNAGRGRHSVPIRRR
jgi:hypothetical protein